MQRDQLICFCRSRISNIGEFWFTATWTGATLNKTGSSIKATDVSGDFDIDGGQVAHADVRGDLLGGSFQMQARTPRNRPVTRTQLDFRGTVSADAVRTALSLSDRRSIGGQTDWRAVLKMTPEPTRERSLAH